MARTPFSKKPIVQRALVVLATVGVALGAGATTASAASPDAQPAPLGDLDAQSGPEPQTGPLGHAVAPVVGLKPNPLAGTGVDPLDNGVGTQVADFRPVSSQDVTRPVAQAPSVGAIPVVGEAARLLTPGRG
ncbi:hypothetical protein [Streptomyces sp. NPDC006610]|uniref:hypothetical protein n=1 Tax=Streptomyces sp. NPDC006610 TaxID=3154584 RepID=UPI0033ABD1BC